MSESQGVGSITSVLQETRVFPPPAAFARQAHISGLDEYEALWNRARDDPEGFWAEQAAALHWDRPWDKVLDWNPPFAKWFVCGRLNASYNCVDRHCQGPDKNKAALIWEGEPGDRRVLRYQDLQREV
jgi:acetyl-CoA synthetase